MKVLLVDDEPEVAEIVSLAFSFHRPDYEIVHAENGWEALRKTDEAQPDIIILDVAMPGLNGFEVTQRLRARSDIPIILLTAKGLEEDKVRGLETGADDYIVKPFGPKELMARVDAVLRRTNAGTPESRDEIFDDGRLRIDFNARRAYLDGQPLELTPTEYSVLYHLVVNRGRVMPQEELLTKVWGREYRGEVQYLKVYVRRLREKLGDKTDPPSYIRTSRGAGYIFQPHTQGA
ncbi:MAG TPA: response regulator transcription factor [Chloroflexota bacterium]|nr:response regulator transcription factor [Chloroflexota bacterium]